MQFHIRPINSYLGWSGSTVKIPRLKSTAIRAPDVHTRPGEAACYLEAEGERSPRATTEAARAVVAGYGMPNHRGAYAACGRCRRRKFANYARRQGSEATSSPVPFRVEEVPIPVCEHSSLEMTRRCANLMTEDLQAMHERVSLLSWR
jgi:hypothetical protein